MKSISYAVKVSPEIRKSIKEYCTSKGIKQGYFVEKALREKLEREKDIEDAFEFHSLRNQERRAVALNDYLKQRKK